ncbi:MAG: hypothetical protein ACYC91_04620 [Solirubrobacteraceae bacterium]
MAVLPALLLAGLVGLITMRRRRRRQRLPARAVIVSAPESTSIARDQGVKSVQSADLTVSRADLERLWSPQNLENLARTYWRFLSKVTLGLIRVAYGENERAVMLLVRPLTLLRFDAPDYTLESDHGKVVWRIRDGLLVAKPGRGSGFLALDVRRFPEESCDAQDLARLHIDVEVANFYPSIAAGFSTPVYQFTQSFLHVLVTHGFLRSLATLELASSRIGRLADGAPGATAVAEGLDQP